MLGVSPTLLKNKANTSLPASGKGLDCDLYPLAVDDTHTVVKHNDTHNGTAPKDTTQRDCLPYLPVCLNVAQRRCLVVGGGEVAQRKATLLVRCQAHVTLVAPAVRSDLCALLRDAPHAVLQRHYATTDLDDVDGVVFVCTDDAEINLKVATEARARRLSVNVADDSEKCTFVMPAIVDRSPVTVAVSSSGNSPILARQIKTRIEALLPSNYGRLASLIGQFRDKVQEELPSVEERRKFWERELDGPLADLALNGCIEQATRRLEKALMASKGDRLVVGDLPGEVSLIGCGPGDPDLLTVKAVRCMQLADVLVIDRLVPREVIDVARKDAQRIFVGKEKGCHTVPQGEINKLLVELALQGKRVCRLKGGDPFIYGRGGEEAEELAQAGIPCQVVPGISAVSGVTAYAGIPLTHRTHASSVKVLTGHSTDDWDWQSLVNDTKQTIVVFMALDNLQHICEGLQRHGMSPAWPVAVIENGTTAQQRVVTGTVSTAPALVVAQGVKSPALVVIGRVVDLHGKLSWFNTVAATAPNPIRALRQSAVCTGYSASAHVALSVSDSVFIYGPHDPIPGTTEFLNNRLPPEVEADRARFPAWNTAAQRQALNHRFRNGFGSDVQAFRLGTTSVSGSAALVCASQGQLVSVMATLPSLPLLLPSLESMCKRQLPAVVYLCAEQGLESLHDAEAEQQPLRAEHTDARRCIDHLLQLGITVLSASDAQQCHDLAVVASTAAVTLQRPVALVIERAVALSEAEVQTLLPESIATQLSVQLLRQHRQRFSGAVQHGVELDEAVSAVLEGHSAHRHVSFASHCRSPLPAAPLSAAARCLAEPSLRPNAQRQQQANGQSAVLLAVKQTEALFDRDTAPVRYLGPTRPEVLVVSSGSSGALQLPALAAANFGAERVGVLSVSLVSPLACEALRSAVEKSLATARHVTLATPRGLYVLHSQHATVGAHAAVVEEVVRLVQLHLPRCLAPCDLDVPLAAGQWQEQCLAAVERLLQNDFSGLADALAPPVARNRFQRAARGLRVALFAPPSADPVAVTAVVQTTSEEPSAALSPAESSLWLRKAVLFPEAHDAVATETRPELHERTWTVRCLQNKRVTPQEYDRNIMHLEFDLQGTDMQYKMGDALGVYGENDPKLVAEFLRLYGVPHDELLAVPLPDSDKVQVVTAWHLISKGLDVFGKPGKKFYQWLSDHATDPQQRATLLQLSGKEGAAEFERRATQLTVNYCDVLREFDSARPPLSLLCQGIPPVEPRVYSIASSSKMHPTEVHLLVVEVTWTSEDGTERHGQCSHYLSSLRPGAEVTVSLRPSVMVLPPDHKAPVVMAGLGTGMAPFRAFIEERLWYKLRGDVVGPMTLYFGSRHRRMEYLYGEELELYHSEGLLTNLRLAFSRDGPDKVYIQHLMQQDAQLLSSQLLSSDGTFYMCGPTWPVPDVEKALRDSFISYGNMEQGAATARLAELKEEERYVLEVY